MVNHVLHGIYRAFFSGKRFKKLREMHKETHDQYGGPYSIYEVWFYDNLIKGKRPAEFSHNIVIHRE